MAKKTKKSDKVWKYLLKNKLATPAQVARATGVSYAYAHKLMKNIGTPREVFEAEALKEQNDFEKSILSAPVREPMSIERKALKILSIQAVLTVAIVGVILVWLYTAL
jgi:hypothetical protein